MTYKFGRRSKQHIATLRKDLQQVPLLVMSWQIYDFAVICGYRDREAQNIAYRNGTSSKRWPQSKHNTSPSIAFDFVPWIKGVGIPWKDTHAFAVLGGMFLVAGNQLGVPLRYGGDWDMDGQTTDQRLMDWGHVEIRT